MSSIAATVSSDAYTVKTETAVEQAMTKAASATYMDIFLVWAFETAEVRNLASASIPVGDSSTVDTSYSKVILSQITITKRPEARKLQVTGSTPARATARTG